MVNATTVNGKTTATAPERRWHTLGVPLHSTLLAPPTRMLLARASAWREGDGWQVVSDACPVLALHSRTEDRWLKQVAPDRDPADVHPDHKALEAAGWAYGERVEQHGVLYLDGSLLASTNDPWEGAGWSMKIVCCTWPAEEDAARLRPVFEALEARALENAKREESRKAGAKKGGASGG
jgi:hypothetical protein